MIELKEISKTYSTAQGQVNALSNVSLTINDGDIYGIIGLSGAGKSTLVRCINLLERPTGSVIIDGEDITKKNKKELSQLRKNIGMIFQNFNLLEQRNALDNVCFPLELKKVARKKAVEIAYELLDVVGVKDKAKSYPSQLSGGQKQRVAIARALANNPKYLLCDEATSALDPNTTKSILDILKKINRVYGVTIVVITHEMNVIESICNKVAVLDNGKIVEEDYVTNLFSKPKSEMARRLILPKMLNSIKNQSDKNLLRLIFSGNRLQKPFISSLVCETKMQPNIIFADVRQIEDKSFGHLVIQLNDEKEMAIAKDYAKKNGVEYA